MAPPVRISAQSLMTLLEHRLGYDLAHADGLCADVLRLLESWQYHPDDIAPFRSRIEELLFQSCYTLLGKKMRYRTQSGSIHQVKTEHISELADWCLALLLPLFPPDSSDYPILQSLAFDGGLYAALLTLCLRYEQPMGTADHGFIRMMLAQRCETEDIPSCIRPEAFPS